MRFSLLLLLVACEGSILGGVAPAPSSSAASDPPASVTPDTPATNVEGPHYASARCEGLGMVRSYTALDGTKLEASRANSASGLDARHTRTWERTDDWGADMNEKLGYYLASIDVARGAMVPVRSTGGLEFWYANPPMGALELYSQFRLGFLMCAKLLTSPPDPSQRDAFVLSPTNGSVLADFTAAPTAESAPRRCESMMRRFWKLVPTPEQIAACAQFAVDDTADLASTPAERWAYVCASLLTSTGTTTQ